MFPTIEDMPKKCVGCDEVTTDPVYVGISFGMCGWDYNICQSCLDSKTIREFLVACRNFDH